MPPAHAGQAAARAGGAPGGTRGRRSHHPVTCAWWSPPTAICTISSKRASSVKIVPPHLRLPARAAAPARSAMARSLRWRPTSRRRSATSTAEAQSVSPGRHSRSCSAYSWPGNVRELRNVVERLLLLADGAVDAALGPPGAARRRKRGAGRHAGGSSRSPRRPHGRLRARTDPGRS